MIISLLSAAIITVTAGGIVAALRTIDASLPDDLEWDEYLISRVQPDGLPDHT